MSWPVHVAGAIITLFFWYELVTSMDVEVKGGFLSSAKIPAAVVVVVVSFFEYSTSAVRAAGLYSVYALVNKYDRSDFLEANTPPYAIPSPAAASVIWWF